MPASVRTWSPAERRLMHLIEGALDARWGECYVSAQRATLLAAELGTGRHRLIYCEGFAFLPELSAPFAHAWCLLNGQVWDPTPHFSGRTVQYYGRGIPLDIVRLAIAVRRAWGPVALSPLPAASAL